MSCEKHDACPNPECKSTNVRAFYHHMKCQTRCDDCGTSGAEVPHVDPKLPPDMSLEERIRLLDLALIESLDKSVRLWNRLPRAASRGDLM